MNCAKSRLRWVLLLGVLWLEACAASESGKSSSAEAVAGQEASSQPGVIQRKLDSQPGVELQRLEALHGEWQVTLEAFQAGTAQGAPMASGDARITPVLGGRFLDWETRLEAGGEPVESRGRLGYDREHSRYELLWVSELSSAQRIASGSGDPERGGIHLEWSDIDPESKAILRSRTRLAIEDPDHFLLEQWVLDGSSSEWILVSRTSYARRDGS